MSRGLIFVLMVVPVCDFLQWCENLTLKKCVVIFSESQSVFHDEPVVIRFMNRIKLSSLCNML